MIDSRPFPTPIHLMGIPRQSSIKCTQDCAFSGNCVKSRTSAVEVSHPGSVLYSTSTDASSVIEPGKCSKVALLILYLNLKGVLVRNVFAELQKERTQFQFLFQRAYLKYPAQLDKCSCNRSPWRCILKGPNQANRIVVVSWLLRQSRLLSFVKEIQFPVKQKLFKIASTSKTLQNSFLRRAILWEMGHLLHELCKP